MSSNSYAIGEYIKKIRKINNLTLAKLSEASGVSATFISQVENGQRNPSPEVLKKISNAILGADYFQLLKYAGYLENDAILKEEIDAILREISFLESEIDKIKKRLAEAEKANDSKKIQNLQNQIYILEQRIFVLNQNHIEKVSKLSHYSPENLESGEKESEEFLALQKFNSNKPTAIYLDSNMTGNFYFVTDQGPLPEETQEKLRSLIKLTLS